MDNKKLQELKHKLTPELANTLADKLIFAEDLLARETAQVFCVTTLNSNQTVAIQTEVLRQFPHVKRFEYSTRPDLLGGLMVKVGDQLLDFSLASIINRLTNTVH